VKPGDADTHTDTGVVSFFLYVLKAFVVKSLLALLCYFCRVTTAFTSWHWNVPLTGDS